MVFYVTMYNLPFNKRAQPDRIILMVGGNDVRRLNSPEELACKLLAVESVLHKGVVFDISMYVNYFPDLGNQMTIISLSMQPMLLLIRT